MLQSMPTTTWNGGQSMVNTCQGMAGDDGRMSRNSRENDGHNPGNDGNHIRE